jgi:SSS family solute:Na+ symporter
MINISLDTLDILVVVIYFIGIFYIAHRVSGSETSDDYFLAGRNLGWFAIGASLFASNIGSEHLIGLAGSGASSGVAVSQFEILAGIILLMLGWLFVPFYLKSGVTTMPEFLELRYGRAARNYLSFISILSYIITKISATIFAGAVVFEAIGLSFWVGAGVTVIATGIYTIFGGLKAVIYTDAVQVVIMVVGAMLVTYFGLQQLGGFNELKVALEPSFFDMWRPSSDSEFPWTGILFGAPILGVWYWCTDQFIVQRVLSAKNLSQARKGTIFAGYLKMLPLFIFVFPGMIAFAMSSKGMIALEKSDHALPVLIQSVLPLGIKGLVLAGLLAALMSSLSSVFNSCSTLITYDWYKLRNPNATEKQLFKVGQISTVVLVVLGIAWIPLMKFVSGNLFTYIQSVQAYISPPIAAVFLWGIFSQRVNLKGALASLGTGFVLGVGRLFCEINKDSLSGIFLEFTQINFLHFAFILFVICSSVLLIVSHVTFDKDKDPRPKLNAKDSLKVDDKKDFYLSIGLLISIAILWVWFS